MTIVLLVEDNPIDAKAVKRTCQTLNLDWEIIRCADGQSAIEYVSAADNSVPDLVLLDLNLPGLDGKDVLKELRATEQYLTVPVLVVTTAFAPNL